jgi:hypothetical protein
VYSLEQGFREGQAELMGKQPRRVVCDALVARASARFADFKDKHPRFAVTKGTVVGISAAYYAAKGAKIDCTNSVVASEAYELFKARKDELVANCSDDDANSPVADKKVAQEIANVIIFCELLKQLIHRESDIFFRRNWELDGVPFITTWSAGHFLQQLDAKKAQAEKVALRMGLSSPDIRVPSLCFLCADPFSVSFSLSPPPPRHRHWLRPKLNRRLKLEKALRRKRRQMSMLKQRERRAKKAAPTEEMPAVVAVIVYRIMGRKGAGATMATTTMATTTTTMATTVMEVVVMTVVVVVVVVVMTTTTMKVIEVVVTTTTMATTAMAMVATTMATMMALRKNRAGSKHNGRSYLVVVALGMNVFVRQTYL